MARLLPPNAARGRIDAEELRAFTDKMPMRAADPGEFMRKLRDEERY